MTDVVITDEPIEHHHESEHEALEERQSEEIEELKEEHEELEERIDDTENDAKYSPKEHHHEGEYASVDHHHSDEAEVDLSGILDRLGSIESRLEASLPQPVQDVEETVEEIPAQATEQSEEPKRKRHHRFGWR